MQIFKMEVKKPRFTVSDGCNAYYLLDNVTQREAVLGDGVDQDFGLDLPFGGIGTPEFRQAWEDEANECADEYFDAYFGDLSDLLIFDGGDKFADRYTIVLDAVTSPCGMSGLRAETSGSLEALHHCLGVSETDPSHPTYGFSQYGTCHPTFMAETQKQICFLDLPDVVQKHVAKRLED